MSHGTISFLHRINLKERRENKEKNKKPSKGERERAKGTYLTKER